eukprot:1267219-Prymnesium_polylepis.1
MSSIWLPSPPLISKSDVRAGSPRLPPMFRQRLQAASSSPARRAAKVAASSHTVATIDQTGGDAGGDAGAYAGGDGGGGINVPRLNLEKRNTSVAQVVSGSTPCATSSSHREVLLGGGPSWPVGMVLNAEAARLAARRHTAGVLFLREGQCRSSCAATENSHAALCVQSSRQLAEEYGALIG